MIKCDFCDKKAVKNYQKMWISWNVKGDSYSKKPELEMKLGEPRGDENVHVCEEHEEQWRCGEI